MREVDDQRELGDLDRLERERPELFDQVIGGVMSANQAAIEAGWRKVKTPLECLRTDWRKASEEERTIFRKEIE